MKKVTATEFQRNPRNLTSATEIVVVTYHSRVVGIYIPFAEAQSVDAAVSAALKALEGKSK